MAGHSAPEFRAALSRSSAQHNFFNIHRQASLRNQESEVNPATTSKHRLNSSLPEGAGIIEAQPQERGRSPHQEQSSIFKQPPVKLIARESPLSKTESSESQLYAGRRFKQYAHRNPKEKTSQASGIARSNALKFCCSARPKQDTPTGRHDKGTRRSEERTTSSASKRKPAQSLPAAISR